MHEKTKQILNYYWYIKNNFLNSNMNWNYKINKEKTQYPLTVTQKINNKSPLTVYNYTKNFK